jgi:putative endopeptidase
MKFRMALAASAALATALTAGLIAVDFRAGAAPGAKPVIGTWGFDLTAIDPKVHPGDDFFRYSGGTWMKNNTIPADRSRWGSFDMLAAKSEEDVKKLADEVSGRANAAGSVEQKVADFYTTYLDTKAIDAAGLKPFEADLARIAGFKTHEDVAAFVADPAVTANSPVGWGMGIDDKNPDRYSINIGQAGLGMPDRDYYLKDDPKFVETRGKYRAYIEQMLSLAKIADAAKSADAIMALETKIARIQWPIEKLRDRDLNYNAKTQAELKAFAPAFPWDAALAASGLSAQNFFIVGQPEAVVELSKLFRATPVETWRAYMAFHFLNGTADVMPTAFDDAAFAFNGQAITGQPQKRARWKRATLAMSGAPFSAPLAEAVGQLYVKRHFTPKAKAEIKLLVDNLLAAYRKRIETLEWMSPETRKVALRKALTARIKIGYPDRWRDYSKLDIRKGDVYGNRKRSAVWDWQRQVARMNKVTDKDEWGMGPQTVNAYYNPQFNEIVFPAAILQAPFFDANADAAINYGAIGGVIGHEMGHGYDDQGAKSDENGILRSWWQKEDEERFGQKVKALAAQYSQFEPLPGLKINGDFTSGENIGDLGGLSVAKYAYELSLGGEKAPVLDGFSGEQRVFLGWCQVWWGNIRDDALRARVTADVHSPAEYRCNGVVRNMDGWYDAFGVKPGHKLYLKPEERVRIW